jgi:arsenate reductase
MKRKVLFLCTSNSARSQMAEAILNHRGGDRFTAYSAGSEPADKIHPLALKAMTDAGIDISGKRTKSMNEFINRDLDFIITLCDKMKENCPVFPGKPILAHWGLPDPADFDGGEAKKLQVFQRTMMEISQRISLFLNIPMEKLDRMAVEKKVREIGTQTFDTLDNGAE